MAEGEDDHLLADLHPVAIDLLVVLVGDDRVVGEVNLVGRAINGLDRDLVFLECGDRADDLELLVGANTTTTAATSATAISQERMTPL